MKKSLLFIVLLTGLFAVTYALMPTEQAICSYEQVETTIEAAQPVIYQASVFDSIWSYLKDMDLGAIITLLMAGGLTSVIASVRKAKKEIQDVINTFHKIREDGKITEAESEQLIQELTEAIAASTKLWYLIAGVFKKKKTK